eukprot:1145823-Pelagomonas_calceolata.AAC.2
MLGMLSIVKGVRLVFDDIYLLFQSDSVHMPEGVAAFEIGSGLVIVFSMKALPFIVAERHVTSFYVKRIRISWWRGLTALLSQYEVQRVGGKNSKNRCVRDSFLCRVPNYALTVPKKGEAESGRPGAWQATSRSPLDLFLALS